MTDIASDGSPVEIYRSLPPSGEPELIHGAVHPGATLLELGCGAGRITHPLIALGHHVVAVDNSPEMLANVTGAETVLADMFELDLQRRFDAVILASHLINNPDQAQRFRLLEVCKSHAKPGGVVLVQRYNPRIRDAQPQTAQIGRVTVKFHDVVRDRDLLRAAVTYQLGGKSWTQGFTALVLDDDQIHQESARVGLILDRWLDDRREWARLTA